MSALTAEEFEGNARKAWEKEKAAARHPQPLVICSPEMLPVWRELLDRETIASAKDRLQFLGLIS